MTKQLRIAAVVPVYNTDLYLEECLDSILAQTYENFDVYVINDASTDKSEKILEEYKLKDPRILLYHTPNNVGVSRARNHALALIEKSCNYDIICFIDSDDVVMADYFESIISNFNTFKSECIIVGYKSFDKRQKHQIDRTNKFSPFELDQDKAYKFCFGLDCFSQKNYNSISFSLWNMAFKTKTVKGIRFNEKLKTAEDQDYILKCLGHSNQLTVDNNIYYFYRIRKSSLTNSNKVRLSDIDTFLYWIIYQSKMSVSCRRTVEHLAIQNFWRTVREAANEKKLFVLWNEFQTRLKIMEKTFITNEINSRKSKKRIFIFNLGKYAASLYFKISQSKTNRDHVHPFD